MQDVHASHMKHIQSLTLLAYLVAKGCYHRRTLNGTVFYLAIPRKRLMIVI